MPVDRNTLLTTANELLKPEMFSDYCPNGLQVEGVELVSKLVAGVTASQALIDRAVDEGADALLVHHGFFWKGEDLSVVGMKYRRLKKLIENGVNLIAYHLPLDAHPVLGNNVLLADKLNIEITGGLEPGNAYSVGNVGRLNTPLSAEQFGQKVTSVLGRAPLVIEGGDHLIRTIAWCTGSAQGYIDRAAMCGADAYLSGEISEPTVHSARELGVHYIAAGHHATERYGVQGVGEYLANQFDLDYTFIDIDNPV
jgi:dinuclear metal center YbgI/SA1388 family protein